MKIHTQEPWYVGAQNDALYIIDTPPAVNNDFPFHEKPVFSIGHIYDIDNANRIVACVNACKGLSNEELANSGYKGAWANTLIKKISAENLNAELLQALYTALPFIEDAENDPVYKKGHVSALIRQLKLLLERASAGK